ncbi:hypothetical protein [Methylovulum psychrotolerans]|uniref:Uncharacterized protein n=1 Tax=Methylovulum psychrotolerans TaxID=1704499 RepID=A0A2S5CGN5_9GAMM|nr:hypothetical protein [Methylovulum psychrotolerans]POZ49954.1 hypothetical protein AADEFJLK_04234 [Methylovulum psychrotolerans]
MTNKTPFCVKKPLVILLLAVMGTTRSAYSQEPVENGFEQIAADTSTVQVDREGHVDNVDAAFFVVTKKLAADKPLIAEIIILREPKTGLTWWSATDRSSDGYYADSVSSYLRRIKIYLTDDAIGIANVIQRVNFGGSESTEKYPSMAEAKSQALKNLFSTDKHYRSFDVPMWSFMPDEFYLTNGPSPKVESVHKKGGVWKATIVGVNNVKMEVEINAQQHVTKAIFYPKPKAQN